MLNWRRDPDYEQRKMLSELRIRQIENETEQLRQENARGRQLLASIDALCFPPEYSSTHPNPTEPDSRPSSR
ncbi:MAG: hypothetical protein ACK5N0_06890 [Synechococcaceae cyanobacterium]|jgi:hypothetical protein